MTRVKPHAHTGARASRPRLPTRNSISRLRDPRPGDLGRALLVFWSVCTLVAAASWIFTDRAQFAALGVLGCLIVTVPLARRSYRVVSAWSLVVLIVYLGLGLRGTAVAIGWGPDPDTLQRLFLRGEAVSYFLWPTLLHLLFLVLMTTVYLVASSRRLPLPPRPAAWQSLPRIRMLILAVAGLMALAAYIHVSGDLSISSISNKSAAVSNAQVDADHQGRGVLILLSSLSAIVFWIVTAHLVHTRRGRAFSPLELGVIAGLGLVAILHPFFSSSRSQAVIVLLVGAGIVYLLDRRRLRFWKAALFVSCVIVVVAVMTVARAAARNLPLAGGQIEVLGDALLKALIYNRNFGDPWVTSHIVHHVPGSLPYQYGETILVWLVAGVPRSIWAEKPLISSGPLIGHHVYGQERAGVPPGVVGDWYLNFGVVGVVVGALLVGALLAYIDRWGDGPASPKLAVLYVPLAIGAAKAVMSQGLGAALFQSSVQLALTIVCLAFLFPPSGLTSRWRGRARQGATER